MEEDIEGKERGSFAVSYLWKLSYKVLYGAYPMSIPSATGCPME